MPSFTQVLLIVVGVGVGSLYGCSSVPPDLINEAKQHSSEFLLGPEDVLEVNVWRNQDLSRVVVVRPDGMVSLPLMGDVRASGLTASQVADKIAKRLSEFKENPSVSVSVKEVNSYYFYVLGEVARPGKYPIKSYATVLQSVSIAGGFTLFASKNKIHVLRTILNGSGGSKDIRLTVSYGDLLSGEGPLGNFTLKSGDTVVVP
jgi:polysaccharide export outer membrane protein